MNTEHAIADRIFNKPGVIAVRVHLIKNVTSNHSCVCPLPGQLDEVSSESQTMHREFYERVLTKALALYDIYGNAGPLRILQGSSASSMTISCYAAEGYAIAVVVPTGHMINKSLRRMLGRAIASNLKQAA